MDKPVWMWMGFLTLVGALLYIDLGVLHKKAHEVSFRESMLTTLFYVAVALAFGGFVWWKMGAVPFKEYLTGYIVEYTLSMDNIFVMSVIFSYLGIPRSFQHRVLFWGIMGVIILRGIMIAVGAALVHKFEWILFVFAAFLVFTGIKMLVAKHEGEMDLEKNPLLKYLRNHFKITSEFHGQKFFVKKEENGKLVQYITPLFVALLLIEAADVVFAVDSIPAIFAITKDPYIVFTSNLFAILGLRSLYFSLSAMVDKFAYLKRALALVLIFIGGKVFATPLLGLEKFPAGISLGVTVGLLAWGVLWSLWRGKNPKKVA